MLPLANKGKNKYLIWVKFLLLVLIVVPLAFVLYQSDLTQFFMSKERLVRFIDSLGPLGPLGLILLQTLQVVVAPIPGEVTNIIGGFLYGPFWGVVLSTIGVTLGSYVAFILARIFGRPFVEKYVSKSIIKRFDYLLHHKGVSIVFLIFLIPGSPKDSLCYLLGLGHLTSVEFLIIGGVGRLFGTIVETLGGDYIRHEQYRRLFVLTGITLIIVLFAMIYNKKLEKLLRILHIKQARKDRVKRRNIKPKTSV